MLTADIRGTLKEHTAQLGPDDLIFVQVRGCQKLSVCFFTSEHLDALDKPFDVSSKSLESFERF